MSSTQQGSEDIVKKKLQPAEILKASCHIMDSQFYNDPQPRCKRKHATLRDEQLGAQHPAAEAYAASNDKDKPGFVINADWLGRDGGMGRERKK